jgi:hypothetical protein
MADKVTVTYGELNWETVGRWLHLASTLDNLVASVDSAQPDAARP